MPLRRHFGPFKASPSVERFDIEAFIASLATTSPRLKCFGVSGDIDVLYRRFIGSPNFELWLSRRLKEAYKQLEAVQLEILSNAEFSVDALAGRGHAEIVDLILRLQELLRPQSGLSSELRASLHKQFESLLGVVDDELKLVLMSNEQLRELVLQ